MDKVNIPCPLIEVNEEEYGKTEIERLILNRLKQAANDPEIRKLMEAEARLLVYEQSR